MRAQAAPLGATSPDGSSCPADVPTAAGSSTLAFFRPLVAPTLVRTMPRTGTPILRISSPARRASSFHGRPALRHHQGHVDRMGQCLTVVHRQQRSRLDDHQVGELDALPRGPPEHDSPTGRC